MVRLLIFLFGLGMIVLGVLSRFSVVELPVDFKTIPITFVYVSYSLDIVLMVAGLFLVLMVWLFHKLAQ
jgi:hypothetical protein